MKEVAIVSAVRSAFCRRDKGQLADYRPDDLMADVIRESLSRTPQIDWHDIEDVLIGCASQEGEQGLNLARSAAIMAGLPASVPAATVNRYCASSLTTLIHAADGIKNDCGDLFITGGVESFTRVQMGGFNPSPSPRLLERNPDALTPPGVAAENLARKYNISREEQDAYAASSHEKALKAWSEGFFSKEVVSIKTKDAEGREILVARDELPRECSPGKLAELKPVFLHDGTVTAGNSASLADGAAVVVPASLDKCEKIGLPCLATLKAWAVSGCPAEIMSFSAVEAAGRALKRSNLGIDEMDAIELSEPFAASAIACAREMGIEGDKRVNSRGGAIALGHSFGANGARMICTLLHSLEADGGRYGLLAIGGIGGQGVAIVVERQ